MKRKKRSLHARLRGLARRGVKALFWAALLLLAVRANISFFRGAFERALENGVAFLICAPIYAHFERVPDALSRLWKRGDVIDNLLSDYAAHPTDFEKYVAGVYRRLGYRARVTRATGDGGIDVHLWRDGVHYAVEVKLYARGRRVGREYIQKLWAAQLDAKADAAIFVATCGYTAQAIEFAGRHDIILVDGDSLKRMISAAGHKRRFGRGR